MHTDSELPGSTRSMIVLIALLQGLLLYTAQELAEAWPFRDIGWRYSWYAWVLTVPSAVALTVVDLRDRRLWLHAALASLPVLALAGWTAWNLSGATGLYAPPLQLPLSWCLGIAVFIALPWWQFRLQHGHWRADYASLFGRAWQNGLTLALAAAFTGLTWLLLMLWAALFQLLKISFFSTLFNSDAFIALATGALVGFGVLIGRTQHRAIQVMRQVLFTICRGLLPLVSFIAVLFVLALPFTGLAPLWATRSAAVLMLLLAGLLIGFTNAVYQQDAAQPPYWRWLRRLVAASLLTLPVYACLALYAMALRIGQYGWSVERFWGLLVGLLAAGYALGYALAALQTRGRWLQRIEPVNRWMCWLVLACVLLAGSPLVDPVRITIASQTARLAADPTTMNAGDASLLRFELGRRGTDALRALKHSPAVAADARASSIIDQALAQTTRNNRWEVTIDEGVRDPQALRKKIELAAGTPAPEASWWQALVDRTLDGDSCLDRDEQCIVLQRDLDDDGQPEILLCSLPRLRAPFCRIHRKTATGWTRIATVSFSNEGKEGVDAARQALRENRLQLAAPRWPTLVLDGVPSSLSIDDTHLSTEKATP